MASADFSNVISNKGYNLKFLHIPSSKTVEFKAFLTTNGEAYPSEWKDESVYGRMDPLSTFSNTRRTFNLAFVIHSFSQEDSIQNLKNLSILSSFLYPAYNIEQNSATISTAPLIKLTFANLINNAVDNNGLLGRITNFNSSYDLENGFDDPEAGKLYPKLIYISFNYTVYHTHSLGWSKDGNFRTDKFPYQISYKTDSINTTKGGGGSIQQQQSLQNNILKNNNVKISISDFKNVK